MIGVAALAPGDGLIAEDETVLPMESVGLRGIGEHTQVSMIRLKGVGELRVERGRNGGNGA